MNRTKTGSTLGSSEICSNAIFQKNFKESVERFNFAILDNNNINPNLFNSKKKIHYLYTNQKLPLQTYN